MAETKIIEVTNGPQNWGKFMLMRFVEEWNRRSHVESKGSLFRGCGWRSAHLWVLDLQTGEGIFILPGGSAKADLEKHAVWVCPPFKPFLSWLYQQDLADIRRLPDLVDLPDAPFALTGYRRLGKQTDKKLQEGEVR